MTERTRALIDLLLRNDALTFGDFVAKSGRPTPYFVNVGKVGSGAALAELGRLYADAIVDRFGTAVDVLFGPAYKGIPLAVATGVALAAHHGRDVGICFDRKEAKDHGEGGNLVGHLPRPGERVVVVEDVTTAGTSIRTTVPMLQALGDVEVVGLVVGVDRRERGSRPDVSALDELSAELGLTTLSLATIDDIVAYVRDLTIGGTPVASRDDLARIEAYRATYGVA